MRRGSEIDTPLNRLWAWMGIAFVVLLVVGFIVFPTPSDNKDTAKWLAWWADSGHRIGAILGAYLMVLGALAFIVFAWGLSRRLLADAGPVLPLGALFATLVAVSAMVRATIPGSKQFGSTPLPGADFARQFDQIGFALLLVAGALSAGAFLAVMSYSARQNALLPGWLSTAGYVVAVLQLAGAFFFPFLLFVLYILVASIVLVRQEGRATTPAAAAPSG